MFPMPTKALAGYIATTMALGLAANLLDPDMTSVWMRECFLAIGIGFFGELAIRASRHPAVSRS
jgi:hypothetical protein